jgi:hypothetical protein
MLRSVALVRIDVSEELSFSIIRVTRIGELGTLELVTANVVPSSPIPVTLMMVELISFEMSILTRATRPNTPEDGIFHSHRREYLIFYKFNTFLSLQHDTRAVLGADGIGLPGPGF